MGAGILEEDGDNIQVQAAKDATIKGWVGVRESPFYARRHPIEQGPNQNSFGSNQGLNH